MADPYAGYKIDPFTGQVVKSGGGYVDRYVPGAKSNSMFAPDMPAGTRRVFMGGDGMEYSSPAEYQRTQAISSILQPQQANNPYATGSINQSNRFEAGLSANEQRLNALLTDPNAVKNTAAYNFRLKQGEDALQRQLGAKGLLNSGNRLMELTKYGQDMATQEYDNQFGRLRDLVGMYSGNWVGDKNANTGQFSAQASAWNQANATAQRDAEARARLAWDMQKDANTGSGSTRTVGVQNSVRPSPYSVF